MNYKQIYDNIINYRLDNPLNGYTEKHHILPRSLGGNDDKSNLVDLSAREHYICHLLLTKIYPKGSQEYYKMIKAYNLMAKASSDGQRRDYKINVNLYENLRVELSNALSLSQSGCGNSQYKTFLIYNPSTLECKKVPSDFIIEDGWFKGRVTNWETHATQLHCKVCNKKGLPFKYSVYCSDECKQKIVNPKKEKIVHARTKRTNDSKSFDWMFLLNIYHMYGMDGLKILCNVEFTSRNNFLIKCRKELGDEYYSNQKTKKSKILYSKI